MIDPWTYATDEKLDVEKRTLIVRWAILYDEERNTSANIFAFSSATSISRAMLPKLMQTITPIY